MNIQKLFSSTLTIAMVATVVGVANGQTTEQAARDRAITTIRSQLHLNPGQFLSIQRQEELGRLLALIAPNQISSFFIYQASQAGDEVKGNIVIHHIFMDIDPTYIIAINSSDRSVYRIHGFGLSESLADFERLMATLKLKVASSDQAESLADFYRKVNPENQEGLTPISGLLEFKQAAERQCQSGAKSFDMGEKAFAIWWNHARSLYTSLPFQQSATPHGSGYLVEWIILSSPSKENCGGAPLRAQLEVGSDGHVGKLTFSPI